jgi:hypothetical protein
MDVPDVTDRRTLRGSCVRVASAFDAELPALDAGPVQKVVVALWSSREPLPDACLPERLDRDDDVVEVSRSINVTQLLGMDADARARHLLAIHHGALRALCARYQWDGAAVDSAKAAAEASGIIARRRLPAVPHRNGRWIAEAEGCVNEQGLHIAVRVSDPESGAVIREVDQDMPGGWHDLRGLLHGLTWRGSEVRVKSLRRAALVNTELPTLDMSET